MTTTNTANNKTYLNTEKMEMQIAEFLQEHREIETILPVVIGVIVTTRFQLRGANALLVNLLVASVSRQLLTNLKKPASHLQTETNKYAAVHQAEQLLGVAIAHSIPGRLRLQIPRLATDSDYARRLENLLSANENVITVRINRAAASIAINYETGQMTELELGLGLRNIIEAAEGVEQTHDSDNFTSENN